ncbi:MAG: DASS family sodium-coupled anion symporter [Alphaproteobacteria bacterium]
MTNKDETQKELIRRYFGLWAGIIVLCVMLFFKAPEGLTYKAWVAAAIGLLMAIWWVFESIPIAATALVPLVLAPMLGVSNLKTVAAPYSEPTVYLFMGGFIIAVAMEKWGLHKRLALSIIKLSGVRPAALVAGFMAATAFLSMWISNTATATMMLPIALSVISLINDGKDEGKPNNFAIALLLSIAFSASIGGLATLVGTPPNALFAGFMSQHYNIQIGFGQWMMIGLPISIIMLFITWFFLTQISFPLKNIDLSGAENIVKKEIASLGKMSNGEARVAIIFTLTAVTWIFSSQLKKMYPEMNISDAGIAIAAALLLFLTPSGMGKGINLMDWDTAKKIPWGVLVLVGGGLSLGNIITSSGLSDAIAGALTSLDKVPVFALISIISVVVMVVSHLTSNTATAAAFLPLVAGIALVLGQNPMLLAIPTVIAASCVFMMPVATPPNAIVFASGMITVPQMVRAGFLINILALVLTVVVAYTMLGTAFGVVFGVVPDWALAK